MAFQTPQNNGNQHEGFSLLFSPPTKASDGQKQPSGLGRSPSLSPGFGTAQTFSSREQTPPSRRRSLTPASSMAKDTPPPPPSGSLLDSPGVPGPSLAGWAGPQDTGVEDMSTSPIGGGAQPQAYPAQPQSFRDYGAGAMPGVRDYDSTWVTVFGFSQGDVPLVLREFGKCGDIVQFGTFEDGPRVNWLHINYANKHAAQRALLRDGDHLSASCMVGVKPLDAAKRETLERQSAGGGPATRAPALPKLAASRPYQVTASASQSAVVPLASKSAWEKVSEFILGI